MCLQLQFHSQKKDITEGQSVTQKRVVDHTHAFIGQKLLLSLMM
jgi:hypothetical protein